MKFSKHWMWVGPKIEHELGNKSQLILIVGKLGHFCQMNDTHKKLLLMNIRVFFVKSGKHGTNTLSLVQN
jgi:hypothetical protein